MKKNLWRRMLPRVRSLPKIALLMNITGFLLLVTCLQVSATVYSQESRLTLDMKAVPIGKVLKTIESQTDYRFVYSTTLFPAGQLVTVSVKETTVSDILTLIL